MIYMNTQTISAGFTGRSTQVDTFISGVTSRSDKLMNYFLLTFYFIGLFLAFFYDTWLVAFSIGTLSLLAYYSVKYWFRDSDVYQYVLSGVFGIFMAQFIYQMHGLFEMHFIAFIGSAILVTYQNWKLQIPLAIVVIVHHALFGYLQYIGYDKIYFTQKLDYMTIAHVCYPRRSCDSSLFHLRPLGIPLQKIQ